MTTRYTLDIFTEALKDVPDPKPATRPAAGGSDVAGNTVVAEGERNARLASLAGSLRRQGMTDAEMVAAMSAYNATHCQPPLDDAEIGRIAKSIGRYAPAQPSHNGHKPAEPIPPGEGPYVPTWRWCEAGLYAGASADSPGKLVLNRSLEPKCIIRTESARYLELQINGGSLTLAAGWAAMRGPDAAAALVEQGVTLTARQVPMLQSFVADALDVGENIPIVTGAESLGWHGDVLLLGDGDSGGLRFTPKHADARPLEGFGRVCGNEADARLAWQKAYGNATAAAWTVGGAAAGSPILGRMPAPFCPFVPHLIGPRGTGKTTLLRSAAAEYGDPNLIIASWNLTLVGLERLAESARHLPVFLDETGVVERQESLGEKVMMLAAGVGRIRGTSGGGLRATAHWHNVILSTGETAPLAGAVSGVARRVLLIHKALDNAEQVDAFDHAATEFYGWPARWMRDVWAPGDWWAEEIAGLAKFYTDLLAKHPGAHKSQGRLWAIVAAGARCLAQALDLDLAVAQQAVTTVCEEAAIRQIEQLDSADRLFYAVWDDVAAHVSAYRMPIGAVTEPRMGFRGSLLSSGDVAVLGSALHEIGFRMGVPDVDAAVSILKDRGRLDTQPGRMVKKVRVGERTVWAYVFKADRDEGDAGA